jgi:hypothetical protein
MAFTIDLPCGDSTTLTDDTKEGLMVKIKEHGSSCEECKEKGKDMGDEDKMKMIEGMIKEV